MTAQVVPFVVETTLSDADLARIIDGVTARLEARDAVLSTSEAAVMLRCSEPQLRAWIKSEGCPVLKLDGRNRFVRSELLVWARARCHAAGATA